MEDMKEQRSKPLIAIRAIWEKDSISKYPETVKIPMDDGHVVSYRIDVEQPHPQFLASMDLVKKMCKGIGYQYKENR